MFCAVDIWGWTPNIMSLKFIFIALCHSSPHANPNDGNNQLSSIHMLLPLSCNLAATTSNRVLTIALNQGTDTKKNSSLAGMRNLGIWIPLFLIHRLLVEHWLLLRSSARDSAILHRHMHGLVQRYFKGSYQS
jgi:hypothetical protein